MATIKTLNKRRKKKLQEMFKQKHEKWIEKQKTQEEKYKYNPPPSRNLETKQEVGVSKTLEKKEKMRTNPKGNTKFSVWEYKKKLD